MIDLELPHTAGFSPDRPDVSQSVKDIKWLKQGNFFHRLHFEAWTEFEDAVNEARVFVGSLRGDALNAPRLYSAMLSRELQRRVTSEADIDTRLSKDTTGLALSLLESCRSLDFSQWIFAPKRLISSELVAAKLTQSSRGKVDIQEPVSGIPDVGLFCEESEVDGENKKAPIATIEIKHPRARLVPDNMGPSTAIDAIASYFNVEFEKGDSEKVTHPARRFAQALSYAMHSRSGCGMLWTHNEALFFYVDQLRRPSTDPQRCERVCVRVSRLFTCMRSGNNNVTAIHALIAWILQARKLACHDEQSQEERATQLGMCLEHVGAEGMYIYPGIVEGDGGSPVASRTRSGGESGSAADSGTVSAKCASGLCIGARETLFVETQLHDWMLRFKRKINTLYLDSILPYVAQRRNDAVVLDAFRTRQGLIGIGRDGIVMRSEALGRTVALKYWNMACADSFEMLVNEIAMYCEMERRSAKSLGLAVPKLVGIGMHYWVGPVLLTEFVGEAVRRYGSELKVGDEVLGDEEKATLLERVLECVRLLHSDGLRHGDLGFRNIRARKGEDGTWNVWLVDLGMASLCRDEVSGCIGVDVEESECRELFSGLLQHHIST